MKIVIIGDGVAGHTVADTLRKKSDEDQITILTKEPYPFYTRIYLPHYITEERSLDKLILRDEDWYLQKKIKFLHDARVNMIDRQNKKITYQINQDTYSLDYDKLVLATGSSARKIPFGQPNIAGMFALRTIQDANQIKSFIHDNNPHSAFIIGGGLLGIELGYQLRKIIPNVWICEVEPYLLPRQLDKDTSAILHKYLENQGLKILCGKRVQKVLGNGKIAAVQFADESQIKTDMVFQQLGIIPNIDLATQAGLETERGIIVNSNLQTSDPDIYAAGDCVQFESAIWGIIPACMEQAQIVANNLLEQNSQQYSGTYWNTRLKIAGIHLGCYGAPPNEVEDDDIELKNVDPQHYLCKKVFVSHNKLKGAIIMGDKAVDRYLMQKVGKPVDLTELKQKLKK